jgi:hypothetical protein
MTTVTGAAAICLLGIFVLALPAATGAAQLGDLAAPSGLTQLGPVLSWIDNSTGEDGFRIEVRLSSPAGLPEKNFSYEVGADVTSFTLPPEANLSCEYNAISTAVSAFRGGETSQRVQRGIVGECERAVGLPDTGLGAGPSGQSGEIEWWMVVTSVVLLTVGVGAIARGRVRLR